jgi:hypothetical protein
MTRSTISANPDNGQVIVSKALKFRSGPLTYFQWSQASTKFAKVFLMEPEFEEHWFGPSSAKFHLDIKVNRTKVGGCISIGDEDTAASIESPKLKPGPSR